MLAYSVSQNVALLELDFPPANAITFAILDQLLSAMRRANEDPLARDRYYRRVEAFRRGADLRIFRDARSGDEAVQASRAFQEAFDMIEDLPKPVVAAVAGHVTGGGLELAMACHARLAIEGSRFSMPEVKLGINPGGGGTQRLPRLVGLDCALEMLLSGRPIDASRAVEAGLVDAICPAQRLPGAAMDFALDSATAHADGRRRARCGPTNLATQPHGKRPTPGPSANRPGPPGGDCPSPYSRRRAHRRGGIVSGGAVARTRSNPPVPGQPGHAENDRRALQHGRPARK